MEGEPQRIRQVYEGYARQRLYASKWSLDNPGNLAMLNERRDVLSTLLGRAGRLPLAGKQILEVGCGGGRVLKDLLQLGADATRLYGVDVLQGQIESARGTLPEVNLAVADAQHLPFSEGRFDLVLAFTVFSSILDSAVASRVAAEMARVLKPGGAAVVYDLVYRNPGNSNVRGVKRAEIQARFAGFTLFGKRLTLLPLLARRLGPLTPWAYRPLAAVPLLRTHYMAVLVKPG